MRLRQCCQHVAALSPVRVPPPSSLSAAVRTLDEDIDAETIATAIAVVAVLVGGLGVTVAVGRPGGLTMGGLLTVLVMAALLAAGVYTLPVLLAMRRRAAWAGAIPGFVCRVALGMRLRPTLERGVRAGFVIDDPLTSRVPRQTELPAQAVLEAALSGLGPTAQRVTGLLDAAATASDPDTLLDRAVETALDGTREQLRTYATSLQEPVTAIYAFGVVLPLALVGILPAAPLAGFELPLMGLALVLDLCLPLCITVAAVWLVARRPMVDPPPQLPTDHPALGTPRRVVSTGLLGVTAGILVSQALPAWTAWITPAAWGIGGALLARYQPALPTIESIRTTRSAVPDLLALLGDAMADGLPPERALARAGEVPGRAGAIATDAATTRDRLGIAVTAAIGGGFGPLAELDDRQTATITSLVRVAATAGRPGGRALSRYAAHLDALSDLERSVRADLARITGTLGQTAAVYAPAIGGVTVALSTRLRDTSGTLATASEGFALVVGGYVVVLALVLPTLATALQDGPCRVRIGANVGRALLLAGGLFPLVAHLASRLL